MSLKRNWLPAIGVCLVLYLYTWCMILSIPCYFLTHIFFWICFSSNMLLFSWHSGNSFDFFSFLVRLESTVETSSETKLSSSKVTVGLLFPPVILWRGPVSYHYHQQWQLYKGHLPSDHFLFICTFAYGFLFDLYLQISAKCVHVEAIGPLLLSCISH